MRKSLVLVASAIMLALTMVSCVKYEFISYPTEFHRDDRGVYRLYFTTDDPKSITVHSQNDVKRISTCKVGDTVTVFLPVKTPGVYIYKSTFKWTSDNENFASRTIDETTDPCSEKLPPMYTFKAPDVPGTYNVYFRATFHYSAAAEDGFTTTVGFPSSSGNHGYLDKSSVNGTLRVVE